MGGPWATGPSHGPSHRPVVGRFAFGVFAFLVGFGLQAALGSAWIRQSEGHGITEKAPKKPKRGGGDRGSGAWGRYREKHGETVYRIILVGDLEHFFIFPDIGNNNPNWSQVTNIFSEGLKPPTSISTMGKTWDKCGKVQGFHNMIFYDGRWECANHCF